MGEFGVAKFFLAIGFGNWTGWLGWSTLFSGARRAISPFSIGAPSTFLPLCSLGGLV